MDNIIDFDQRNKGIGGSEVAAVLGLSEYSSPYKIWLKKTGQEPPMEANKYTEAGIILESAVAQFFEMKTNYRIIKASAKQQTYVHPVYPFALGTPDRRYMATSRVGKGILECKTTQKSYDDTPEEWFCQLQWYLGIVGLMYGGIAWLERGLDFKYREYEFDKEFFNFMLERVASFWNDHVVKEIPPEPINSTDVERMFRKHRENVTMSASPELIVVHEELHAINDTLKGLEERKAELVDSVKFVMRDAEAVVDGVKSLFTWKASKASLIFDKDRFKTECPELYESYLKETEGSRRFLVK